MEHVEILFSKKYEHERIFYKTIQYMPYLNFRHWWYGVRIGNVQLCLKIARKDCKYKR